jgi:hypothetical protein
VLSLLLLDRRRSPKLTPNEEKALLLRCFSREGFEDKDVVLRTPVIFTVSLHKVSEVPFLK